MKAFLTLIAITLDLFVVSTLTTPGQLQATDPPPVVTLDIAIRDLKGVRYFPERVFSPIEWEDRFKANWYSKALAAMSEPSVSSPQHHRTESYRFLWLRSFDNPVAVRLGRSGQGAYLVIKQLNGDGGDNPGKLVVNTSRSLSSREWYEFTKLLEQSSYWNLPTDDDYLGADGAQWVLEGTRIGRYHVVDRWSPKDGSYRKVCFYLLQLSELKIRKIY